MSSSRTGENSLAADADPERRAPTSDADVERLAEQLGRVVDSAPEEEREELREYAIELVRQEAGNAPEVEGRRSSEPRSTARLGVFGLVALLALVGGILLFVLPPVGIVLFLLALPIAAWGVVQTLLARPGASRDEPVRHE
jgi:hypothetical protein